MMTISWPFHQPSVDAKSDNHTLLLAARQKYHAAPASKVINNSRTLDIRLVLHAQILGEKKINYLDALCPDEDEFNNR